MRKIQFIANCVKFNHSFLPLDQNQASLYAIVVHSSSDDLGSDVVLRADKLPEPSFKS
jgi:hypothetical protein